MLKGLGLKQFDTAAECIAHAKAVRDRLRNACAPQPKPAAPPPPPKPVEPAPSYWQLVVAPAPPSEPEPAAPAPKFELPSAQMKRIREAVAERYEMQVSEITGRRRSPRFVLAKHMAIYFARNRVKALSLSQIGRAFDGLDHSTVLYAVRRIEELCENNEKVAADREAIARRILEMEALA